MSAVTSYLNDACRKFGDGWNRFWFTPSDPLPLGAMRVAVGGIALALVGSMSFSLLRLFGPNGFISVEMVKTLYPVPNSYRWSYLDYATDAASLQGLHYFGVAVLLAYTLGLFTNVTKFLAPIVFLSYFHRGPMLTGVGEPIVAMLLVYLAVGPCGATLSLDAVRRRAKGGFALVPQTFTAMLSIRLIQVHIVLIHFIMFCATLQDNVIWWNGTAVWWLIARPESSLLDMYGLYRYPYVINIWTTALILYYAAFAFFVWNRTARPALVVWSALTWASIALLTGLIPFCAAMFVGTWAFLSADQWSRLLRRTPAAA